MPDFNIQVLGQKELSAKFSRVASSLGGFSEEFAIAGKILTDFYSTQPFLSSGQVYGTMWPELSPEYKKEKERKWPGKPILVASGAMMNAFRALITPRSLTIDNPTEYFAKHQLGEGVPQRVSMALDEARIRLIMQPISDSLKKRISLAWDS